jgi:hypothetical protein
VLKLPCGWGDANPLTRIALDQELKAWRSLSARVRLASISEVD